jgi:stage IV sporulation protein FB
MFESGFLRIFSWRGVPVRLHWTLPLGAFLFGGWSLAPMFWLGFVLLVFLHELGHAVLVTRLRHRVVAIDITGFGGMCRWSGAATPIERAIISWGGVLAQLAALVVATSLAVAMPGLRHGPAASLLSVFLHTNLWLIGLNLLPFPPLDGATAWRIIPLLRRRGALADLRRALLPWPTRARRPLPRARDERPSPPAQPRNDRGMAPKELADLLRDIGNQARNARNDKHRRR